MSSYVAPDLSRLFRDKYATSLKRFPETAGGRDWKASILLAIGRKAEIAVFEKVVNRNAPPAKTRRGKQDACRSRSGGCMMSSSMGLNYYTLLIFAPLLVLTGISGFVMPKDKSPTSGAPTYNIFHIIFGLAGIMIVTHHYDQIRYFNVGFGLIDLYQAAASYLHWFPEKQFRWKKADDILHIVIGLALVLIGIFGS